MIQFWLHLVPRYSLSLPATIELHQSGEHSCLWIFSTVMKIFQCEYVSLWIFSTVIKIPHQDEIPLVTAIN